MNPISLSDIQSAVEVLQQKEATDAATLNTIAGATFESLRDTLVQWGIAGFPNAYALLTLSIQPPSRCSDGQVRELTEYITFCSGKTIQEHVQSLQDKLADITVSYANVAGDVVVVVSRTA